jgi:hypothetical protein
VEIEVVITKEEMTELIKELMTEEIKIKRIKEDLKDKMDKEDRIQ